jgi:hypothetical protein
MKVALVLVFCLGAALARVEEWSCQVDGRRVNTFDDIDYKVPLSTRYAILARDCSSNPDYVVLIRKLADRTELKELKIKTRSHQIVISPVSELNERVKCLIDGRRVNLREEGELAISGVRIIKEGSQIKVELRNKGVEVTFDGQSCDVQVSRDYRRKPCGLCSQVDINNIRGYLSTEGEFEYPEINQYSDDCTRFNKRRQWGYDTEETDFDDIEPSFESKFNKRQWGCDIDEQDCDDTDEFENRFNKRQWGCDVDEQDCDEDDELEGKFYKRQWGYDRPEKFQTKFNKRQWWKPERSIYGEQFENEFDTWDKPEWIDEQRDEYDNEFDRSSSMKKTILKHKLIEKEDKICVSLQRIPQCQSNTYPEKKIEKRVSYKCLNRNHPLAEKLETKVHLGERIPKLQRLAPSMTRVELVPIKCRLSY